MKIKHLLMALLALWGAIGSALADDLAIRSKADWETFCNDPSRYANGNITLDADITEVAQGFNYDFTGTFDGGGHTITLSLTRNSSDGDPNLFKTITGNGVVKNLVVGGTITTYKKYAAGIAVYLRGNAKLQNCISYVTINSIYLGDGTHGGLVGQTQNAPKEKDPYNIVIEDCAFYGTIDGIIDNNQKTYNCAGIAGWSESQTSISNCVAIATIKLTNIDKDDKTLSNTGDVIARGGGNVSNCYFKVSGNNCPTHTGNANRIKITNDDDITSGKLCYLLNGDQSSIAWHQNLVTNPDNKPVPLAGHSTVYEVARKRCNGREYTKAYSNTTAEVTDPCEYNNTTGFCTYCDAINGSHAGEKYQIDNLTQFQNFVTFVNANAEHGSANACLTNDIAGNVTQGISQKYTGTFDGQGHSITVALNRRNMDDPSLFNVLTGSGVIKNLIVKGTISTEAQRAGGIATRILGNATMQNCISYVTINSDVSGDGTHGGLVGQTQDTECTNVTIKDCAFYGTIDGDKTDRCAGIIGWAESKTKISNCVVIANINLESASNSDVIARCPKTYKDSDPAPDVNNCHFQISGTNCPTANVCGCTATTTADSESGKLCYLLNGSTSEGDIAWHQTLGNANSKPEPFGTNSNIVYEVARKHCDETDYPEGTKTYSNTTETFIDAHDNSAGTGFCSYCSTIDEAIYSTGTYQISTLTQLKNFATFVNGGHRSANAQLEADIAFLKEPVTEWEPIGTESNRYAGTFDGRQHKITMNITVASDAGEHQDALFGRVMGSSNDTRAYIHDLIVDGNITSEKKYAAGIASYIKNTTIERCVSFVTLNCTFLEPQEGDQDEDTQRDASYGGIAGFVDAGCTIKDCAFYGRMDSEQAFRFGGIAGWCESGCAGQSAGDACGDGTCTNPNHKPILIQNCNVLTRFNIWKAEGVTDQQTINAHGIARYRNEKVDVEEGGSTTKKDWIDYGLTIENCYFAALRRAYKHDRDNCKETYLWGELWGEACYGLNGNQENLVWYQDLSKDWYPMPYYDADNSEKNARVYKSIKYNNTPVAYSNSESGKSFTTGVNEISGFDDFLMFANAVNAGKIPESVDPRKIQVKLAADITIDATSDDVRHKKWLPIGYLPTGGKNGFCGVIDGDNHTLTVNLPQSLQSEQLQFGIVAYVYEGATIKNLTVNGTLGNDDGKTATAAHPFGYNIFNNDMNDVAIVGKLQTGTLNFDNVTCKLNVKGNQNVGGLVGYMCSNGATNDTKVSVSNCSFKEGSTKSTSNKAAGFIATVEGGTVNISNSTTAGTVHAATGSAGGFIGHVRNANNSGINNSGINISECTSSTTITSNGSFTGGFVGCIADKENETSYFAPTLSISNSIYNGSITSTSEHAGGFLGSMRGGKTTLLNCTSSGNVTALNNVSGMVGNIESNCTYNLTNCLASGTIKATNTSGYGSVGGFLGWSSKVKVTAKSILFNGTLKTEGTNNPSKGDFEKVALFRCDSYESKFDEKCQNLFYKEETYDKVIGGSTTNMTTERLAELDVHDCTTAQLASGEVCWKLGSDVLADRGGSDDVAHVWRQNLSASEAAPNIKWNGTADDKEATQVLNDEFTVKSSFGCNTLLPRSNTKLPSDVDAHTISAHNSETKVLTISEGYQQLTAYKPVFLTSDATYSKHNIYGNYVPIPDDLTNGLLVGVTEEYKFDNVIADDLCYYLGKQNNKVAFYHVVDVKPTVSAYRAYLKLPAGSSGIAAFTFVEGDDEEETAIHAIEENAKKEEVIYNLSGQRINRMQRGVNIINGKKVLK